MQEFQIWVRWSKHTIHTHGITWNATITPDRMHGDTLFCRL